MATEHKTLRELVIEEIDQFIASFNRLPSAAEHERLRQRARVTQQVQKMRLLGGGA